MNVVRRHQVFGPHRRRIPRKGKRTYLEYLVSHPFMRTHKTFNVATSNQDHGPSDQNYRNDRDHFSQPCVLRSYRKLHKCTGGQQDRSQIVRERPRKVPHDPPKRALGDSEDGLDALVYVRWVEHDHVSCTNGHVCAGTNGHPRVGLCEGDDIVRSVSDEHYVGRTFGSSSGCGLSVFLNGTNEIGLRLGRAPSNGVIWLDPELSSDRFDDTRFISTENVDVDLPLCEPPDECLGSGFKFVNQAKDGNGFPIECDRKDRPRFPAQFVDGRMFAKVQPSAVSTP